MEIRDRSHALSSLYEWSRRIHAPLVPALTGDTLDEIVDAIIAWAILDSNRDFIRLARRVYSPDRTAPTRPLGHMSIQTPNAPLNPPDDEEDPTL